MTLCEGPNLPDDAKFERWEIEYLGSYLSMSNPAEREVALAAGWVEEIPDPPSFDEVLVRVAGWGVVQERSLLLSAAQRAVWDAAVVEARKRLAEQSGEER